MENLDNLMNLDSDIYRRRFRHNLPKNLNLDPKLNTLDVYKYLSKVRNYSNLVPCFIDDEETCVVMVQYETQVDIVYSVKSHRKILYNSNNSTNKNDHG